ncbi:Shikimate dehydrogenase (NADP(+)) [Arenibacter antarcticus]|uniref:ThiF family adenylyltransferase n=1 Tax=Arenibacter antarcticus TaxID=2040469 RepID=A0ABW5VF46_9FLAO|nr:HesA/MoeB/ThiF family protein [Arenibacter sp. H213]MCM4166283.1 sulfurtransferase [Arenibacter sp. H213]
MELDRYQRQTNLKDFGPEAQHKLKNASILVIGAGGLGTPALSYLNAMGVGTLGVIDQDKIEITNLQRQVLYTEADLGKSKLATLVAHLKSQNSGTHFKTFDTFINRDNALDIISKFDLVIDGSDNFSTRYLVNDACVILNKPFVSGAIQGFEGQLSVYNFQGGPTYRCLFPNMPSPNEIPNCNDNGVLGVIPGIIGSLQALEAVKVVAEIGEVLSGKLLLFNGLSQSYQTIKFKVNPENRTIKELKESYGNESCDAIPTISCEAFLQLLATKKDIQIIDVRSREEFMDFVSKEIKAINIPLNQLMESDVNFDSRTPIYFICQSGKRSGIGLKIVQEKYSKLSLFSVEGGINKLLTLQ